MKFNCGLTWDEKFDLLWEEKKELERQVEEGGGWHSWFAWYPVKVGSRDCRWLERVERRYTFWYISHFVGMCLASGCPEYRARGTDG
jgi:hypothetical protein